MQPENAKMDGKQLKAWRKLLNLSQKEAAEALGLKRRIFQYYEKGERDGESVKPPKAVRLACWALTQGVVDYLGPDLADNKKKPAKADKSAKTGKAKPAKPEPDVAWEPAAPVVAALVSPAEDLTGTAPVPALIEPAPKPVRPRRPRTPKAAAATAPAKAKPQAK
jgi:transcriptional regulator with XRE-family HTH domain